MKAATESTDKEKTSELPDGDIIIVSSERFRCPEVMIQPSSVGKESSMNEPIAAAIAYGLVKRSETITMQYDPGGGISDASLLTIGNGVFEM